MITPLSWLERVPTYKDQIQKLNDRDLATYGFLGYPLLQAADILVYRAGHVPVGADQVPHVELTREVARRFNHVFGREPDFEEQAEAAVKKMGKKAARLYSESRRAYVEQGDAEAMERARALLASQQNLSIGDSERLFGYLEGGGRIILPEPQSLINEAAKVPGLDGEKMSKSYGNSIFLREAADSVEEKVRTMMTDPARVRRNDPGDPNKCPVYSLHELYSSDDLKEWVVEGCTSAGIGCVDCKKPLIDTINAEQAQIRVRAEPFEDDPDLVHAILQEGAEKARDIARETLEDVRVAVGLSTTMTEPEPMTRTLEIARSEDAETIALVSGQPVKQLPTDLYIPPEAMEVFLETFEGPLDLLLYLIRRQNLDILDIHVADITAQYMEYIALMEALQLELVGEYLVMAALLAEIKSRMLLPKPVTAEEEENDPRAELIRRLQEYEQIKTAAERMEELPREERDIFPVRPERPELVRDHVEPDVELKDLLLALSKVLQRAEMNASHAVTMEPLSVRERMTQVLSRISSATEHVEFTSLFKRGEGRMGVIVTFLAMMELVRERLVDVVQNGSFAPIYLRAVTE